MLQRFRQLARGQKGMEAVQVIMIVALAAFVLFGIKTLYGDSEGGSGFSKIFKEGVEAVLGWFSGK